MVLAVFLSSLFVALACAFVDPLWTIHLPDPPNLQATPIDALSGDMYFVQDGFSDVWAINLTSRTALWNLVWLDVVAFEVFTEYNLLIVLLNQETWAVRITDGSVVWVNNTVQFGGNVVVVNTTLIGVTGDTQQLAGFDVLTGALMWRLPYLAYAVPVLQADNVVAVATRNSMVAVAPSTGDVLWTLAADVMLGATDSAFFFVNTSNTTAVNSDLLIVNAADGATLMRYEGFTAATSTRMCVLGNRVFISDGVSYIAAFSRRTSKLMWRSDLSDPMGVLNVYLSKDTLLLQSPIAYMSSVRLWNITAYNATTGAFKWRVDRLPTISDDAIMISGYIIYVPNLVGYVALDSETGAITQKDYSEPFPIVVGTQVVWKNTLVAQRSDGSISAYPL